MKTVKEKISNKSQYGKKMTEPITKLDDAFVTFYEYATGNFYLRFKEGVSRDTPMSPRLEKMKILIPDNYPNN